MTKQNINGTIVYTLETFSEATYDPAKDAIVGKLSIPDLSKITLSDRMRIEFTPSVYRLMPSKEILKEEGWLVQLVPIAPGSDTVMLSVGGEYLDDIPISKIEETLLKVIFI